MDAATAFIRSLPLTASALSQRHGITVTFSGDTAYTDGKRINLPGAVVAGADKLSQEQMHMIRGYLDHESAHLACNPADMLPNLRRLSGAERLFWNCLQDGRDERLFSEMYPGARENLINLAFRMFQDESEILSDTTTTVLGWLLHYVRYLSFGMFRLVIDSEAEAVDRLLGRKLRDAIAREAELGVFAETYNDVVRHAKNIVALLAEAALQQSPPPQSDSPSDDSENGSGEDENPESSEAGDGPAEDDDNAGDGSPSSHSSNKGDNEGDGDDESSDSSGADNGTAGEEENNGNDSPSSPYPDKSSGGDDGDDENADSTDSCNGKKGGDENSDADSPSSPGSGKGDSDDGGDAESPDPPGAVNGAEGNEGHSESPEGDADSSKDAYATAARQILEDKYDDLEGLENNVFKDMPDTTLLFRGVSVPEKFSSIPGYQTVPALDEKLFYNTTTTLRTRLAGLLQSRERKKTLIGTRGKLIGRKLYKLATDDPRMFAKTQEVESKRVAIHLLVDLSGSMCAETACVRENPQGEMPSALMWNGFIKHAWGKSGKCCFQSELALAAAQAFVHAARSIPQVNVGVTTFPGRVRDGETVTVLLDHGITPDRAPRWNFATGGGTPLAEAVWYAHLRMLQLTEPRKVLILLTDGVADSSNDAEAAVKAAEKSGIEVVGLSLGGKYLNGIVKPGNCIEIRKAEDIAPAYFGLLERLLLGREKAR
jgi:cobalamin biosynthesis protein CobT